MRFSLATMLLITAYAALGCMALVKPAFHWTSLIWNTSLAILALALVGAVVTRGKDRAYWSGFAICGWIHYLVTLGPWAEGRINSYVFSRPVLDFVCILLQHDRALQVFGQSQMLTTQPPLGFFIHQEKVRIYVYFLISGFALFSVLAGVAGGWFANFLFATAENTPAAEPPAE